MNKRFVCWFRFHGITPSPSIIEQNYFWVSKLGLVLQGGIAKIWQQLELWMLPCYGSKISSNCCQILAIQLSLFLVFGVILCRNFLKSIYVFWLSTIWTYSSKTLANRNFYYSDLSTIRSNSQSPSRWKPSKILSIVWMKTFDNSNKLDLPLEFELLRVNLFATYCI